MDKIFERTLLYDFYGELLTSHQRSIYEDVVFNDMSLSEIAQEHGISRQGVHDLLKRCDKLLQDYENRLHLVERFSHAREKIREIVELTKEEACGPSEAVKCVIADKAEMQNMEAAETAEIQKTEAAETAKIQKAEAAITAEMQKAEVVNTAETEAVETTEIKMAEPETTAGSLQAADRTWESRMGRIRELSLELLEEW